MGLWSSWIYKEYFLWKLANFWHGSTLYISVRATEKKKTLCIYCTALLQDACSSRPVDMIVCLVCTWWSVEIAQSTVSSVAIYLYQPIANRKKKMKKEKKLKRTRLALFLPIRSVPDVIERTGLCVLSHSILSERIESSDWVKAIHYSIGLLFLLPGMLTSLKTSLEPTITVDGCESRCI